MGFSKSGVYFLIFYNLIRELYGDDGSVSRRHEHREDDVEHSSADEDGYDSGDRSYFGRYDMPIDESDCGSSQEDLYSW